MPGGGGSRHPGCRRSSGPAGRAAVPSLILWSPQHSAQPWHLPQRSASGAGGKSPCRQKGWLSKCNCRTPEKWLVRLRTSVPEYRSSSLTSI